MYIFIRRRVTTQPPLDIEKTEIQTQPIICYVYTHLYVHVYMHMYISIDDDGT